MSCKSVKLLEDGMEEDDIRDNWWIEIRREARILRHNVVKDTITPICLQIRSHAKALGCNLIVGYSEDTVIS